MFCSCVDSFDSFYSTEWALSKFVWFFIANSVNFIYVIDFLTVFEILEIWSSSASSVLLAYWSMLIYKSLMISVKCGVDWTTSLLVFIFAAANASHIFFKEKY